MAFVATAYHTVQGRRDRERQKRKPSTPPKIKSRGAQALKICADELSPIAHALKTCADELPPIAQALKTCADELPPIAQAGGGRASSCSSYSSLVSYPRKELARATVS